MKNGPYTFVNPTTEFVAMASINYACSFANTRRPVYQERHYQSEIELLKMHRKAMTNPDDIVRCDKAIRYRISA